MKLDWPVNSREESLETKEEEKEKRDQKYRAKEQMVLFEVGGYDAPIPTKALNIQGWP